MRWRDEIGARELAVEAVEDDLAPRLRALLWGLRFVAIAFEVSRVPSALLLGVLLGFSAHEFIGVWSIVALTPLGLGLGWHLPVPARLLVTGLGYRFILERAGPKPLQAAGGTTSVALPSASSATSDADRPEA